jgi:putative DNA primase/helicase
MFDDAIGQFRDAILSAGIEPPKNIVADGKIHRFSTNGSRKDNAGWYLLHLDGVAAGAFGDWRGNINNRWCVASEETMTAEQRAELQRFYENVKREHDAEQQRIWNEAAEKAKKRWAAAAEATDDFSYLVKKRVKSYGLKCHDGRLLVPVRDDRGLRSLQFIDANGKKLFLEGSQAGGGYFIIGNATKERLLYVVEGYATGATVREATGLPVVVAFNDGNLLSVARAMRDKLPDVEIVICADDDYRTDGNPGLTKAKEAAAQIGAKVAIPEFGKNRPEKATEFNDMLLHLGLDRVRERLQAALYADEVETPRPLMRKVLPADPFPIDALGEPLKGAALAIHDRIKAPIAICAQSALAAVTLSVQDHINIVLPNGQKKPVSNYFVTVAQTGERKTAADIEAMAPIQEHEEGLRAAFDVDVASYINDEAAWKIGRENIEKLGRGPKALSRTELKAKLDAFGPAPLRPLEPTLTCDEPTIQGLERHFAVCRPSVGLFATEGGKFIAGHSMADDHKIRTAASLSNLWDGMPIRRLRVVDGSMFMPGRRLAMHLAVQPEIADIMLADRELKSQGLLSRILMTYPDSLMGTRLQRAGAEKTAERLKVFSDRIAAILKVSLPTVVGKLNELAPRDVEMDPRATKMWGAFADKIELQIGRGGNLAPISGLANKLPEIAARLAGVLMGFETLGFSAVVAPAIEQKSGNAGDMCLTAEYLARGIKLAEHYAAEALRTAVEVRADANLVRAQALLDWLHERWDEPAVSLPDIYQCGPYAIRDNATAKRLVGVLEAHGWLVKIKGGAVIKGKKRREAWRIVGA